MRIYAPTQQVSAKNLPSHTQLKFRQVCFGAGRLVTGCRVLVHA